MERNKGRNNIVTLNFIDSYKDSIINLSPYLTVPCSIIDSSRFTEEQTKNFVIEKIEYLLLSKGISV